MSIVEILNKPYPIILNKWKLAIFISIFISLFLNVFQPFGLQFVAMDHKSFILMGYGIVTFVLLLFNLFLLPLALQKCFREENWTVLKQIAYLAWIVLSISIANYFYSVRFSIVHWEGYKGILIFIFFTFPVALIPIVIITFVTQNVYLKRNLRLSIRMNEGINGKISEPEENRTIKLKSGNQSHQFSLNTVVFLESEGNYVNVNFLQNGKLKSKLIRNTLKDICENISENELFKCHRAYAVNTQYIEQVKGNSHGILITLKHIEKQIPVSRSHTKKFMGLLFNN